MYLAVQNLLCQPNTHKLNQNWKIQQTENTWAGHPKTGGTAERAHCPLTFLAYNKVFIKGKNFAKLAEIMQNS